MTYLPPERPCYPTRLSHKDYVTFACPETYGAYPRPAAAWMQVRKEVDTAMTPIYFLMALIALPMLSRVVGMLVRMLVELISAALYMALAIVLLLALASHGRLI